MYTYNTDSNVSWLDSGWLRGIFGVEKPKYCPFYFRSSGVLVEKRPGFGIT